MLPARAGTFKPSQVIQSILTKRTSFKPFKSVIEHCDPDVIVSVHPLTQDIPLCVTKKKAKNGDSRIPFVTVVTDLGGAHPLWFDSRCDLCFVPSEPIYKLALKAGLSPSQIRMHGLPLRSGFWKPERRSKDKVRSELGLRTGLPTALVVGGGDGVGGLTAIAEQLAAGLGGAAAASCGGDGGNNDATYQLVVVCGSNKKLQASLEAQAAAEAFGKGVHVSVQGFVKNMNDFMAASDCIVTKVAPPQGRAGW